MHIKMRQITCGILYAQGLKVLTMTWCPALQLPKLLQILFLYMYAIHTDLTQALREREREREVKTQSQIIETKKKQNGQSPHMNHV